MTALTELARAKVNLTLTVHGRRGDGYHELESLVAFANFGDRLTMHVDRPFSLHVTGPFASAIDGENLIERAVSRLRTCEPPLRFGAFVLEKNLPVAAGIGGGSADAAAALRLIRRANPEVSSSIDWHAIATSLGADVPVCLASETVIMRGFGETVSAALAMPQFHAVLVNACGPAIANKTATVFKALAAAPAQEPTRPVLSPPWPTSHADWAAMLARHGNDLEIAACAVLPEIKTVKSALAAQTNSLTIRLSGAGPTCFGLYENAASAALAHTALATQHTDWWVVATTLG